MTASDQIDIEEIVSILEEMRTPYYANRIRQLVEEISIAGEQFKVACQRAESYKKALTMILQVTSDRVICTIARAAIDGANLTDEDTAIQVCEGRWRKS